MYLADQNAKYSNEDIKNELIDSLFGNYWIGALSSLFLAFIITLELTITHTAELTYTHDVEGRSYIIWFITVFIVILFRILLKIFYDKVKAKEPANTFLKQFLIKHQERFYNLFFLGSALTAIAFGVLGSFLMPSDLTHQAFILIIITGLLAGSVQSLAASYIVNISYTLLVLVPILIWEIFQIYQGNTIYIGILITMITYCIFSAIIAYRNYKMLVLNIKLKHENIQMNKLLEINATHDSLTGLFNRYHLNEFLKSEIIRSKRKHSNLAVIMVDIDKFKHFNDEYGHNVGDTVLKQLGDFLKEHVRGNDIACRIGGDEFVIILTDCNSEIALHRAQELQKKAKDLKFLLEQKTENINFSMGIAIYPQDGTIIDELLGAADTAMYKAKQLKGEHIVLYNAPI